MAVGWSLHIGVESLDPGHYGAPWTLDSPHKDAALMMKIARSKGYVAVGLPTAEAFHDRVSSELSRAARSLGREDYFLLTYSGHGGQVPDRNGDEDDGQDETWCLFDRMMIDDEIYGHLAMIQGGVRVLVLSDSCHSGTVIRGLSAIPLYEELAGNARGANGGKPEAARLDGKTLPKETLDAVYKAHQRQYDDVQARFPDGKNVAIRASVILLGACQDGQKAQDGPPLSRFTAEVERVWRATPNMGLEAFFGQVVSGMPGSQTPHAMTLGPRDTVFESLPPFTIV